MNWSVKMAKREFSSIFHVEVGAKAVATMLRGTSDSNFVLMRGVPSNEDRRVDEYLWADVTQYGRQILLTTANNPVVIDIPGTYKFRNEGFDDEQALIDITTYGRKVEIQSNV